jgi:hypothetical protein
MPPGNARQATSGTLSKQYPIRGSKPKVSGVGIPADIVLDWKDGKLVGLEVLGAASVLHSDLLAGAIHPARRKVRHAA